ncbi:MAG TPA: hypothetical protein VFZ78_10190, partial [Flavisolibacter sp.]
RTLEIDSFKMQPTLEKAEYYQIHQVQQTLYYIEFGKMRFDNFRLDQYIRHNILSADSLSISGPVLESYMDRSQLKIVESRIGKFPHQMLLRTGARINIRSIGIANGTVLYTERNNTGVEGSLRIDGLRMRMKNVTNMKEVIAANNICQADVAAMIFQSSPVAGRFTFYLDSTNGRFDFSGSVRNVSAGQLAPLANALSTTRIRSFTMKELHFEVTANDYDSRSNVQMQYSQLAVDLRKTDPLTQEATTKKFLTKMVNRYMLAPQNPGADGRLRAAKDVRVQRLVTQSFFGLIWKSIFAGMQEIMMR